MPWKCNNCEKAFGDQDQASRLTELGTESCPFCGSEDLIFINEIPESD